MNPVFYALCGVWLGFRWLQNWEAWNHPAVIGRSSAGATLNSQQVQELREEFIAKEPVALRQQVLALLRTWRGYLPQEIWYEELLHLDPTSLEQIPVEDRENARRYFLDFCASVRDQDAAAMGRDAEWIGRIENRGNAPITDTSSSGC